MSHQLSIKPMDTSIPLIDQLKRACKAVGISFRKFDVHCEHPTVKRYHSMKDKNPKQFWCCECLTLVKVK